MCNYIIKYRRHHSFIISWGFLERCFCLFTRLHLCVIATSHWKVHSLKKQGTKVQVRIPTCLRSAPLPGSEVLLGNTTVRLSPFFRATLPSTQEYSPTAYTLYTVPCAQQYLPTGTAMTDEMNSHVVEEMSSYVLFLFFFCFLLYL